MTFNLEKSLDEIYRLGQVNERKRIQIKIIKKQTAYFKSGMVTGSLGLEWLLRELENDRYDRKLSK